jgi:arginine kinase
MDTIPVEKSVDHSHSAVAKKEEFAEKVVEEVVHH